MDNIIQIHHITLHANIDFEFFTKNLESLIHSLESFMMSDVEAYPDMVKQRLLNLDAKKGFMLFNVRNHGKLLRMTEKPIRAKQYTVGNPLIAVELTSMDIRAALYLPLTVLVYGEGFDKIIIDYDQPSSLFAQFLNREIDVKAKDLDHNLYNLLYNAAEGKITE
jgi:uncharacterized protein (DUF302 family)